MLEKGLDIWELDRRERIERIEYKHALFTSFLALEKDASLKAV